MPTEIALVDGTKFQIADGVREALELIGDPVPGWVYISEGEGAPERYFNPANIAYVIEVEEDDGTPLIETFPR